MPEADEQVGRRLADGPSSAWWGWEERVAEVRLTEVGIGEDEVWGRLAPQGDWAVGRGLGKWGKGYCRVLGQWRYALVAGLTGAEGTYGSCLVHFGMRECE